MRVSNGQNVVCSIMGSTSKMNRSLDVQERRTRLFDEDSPSVGEFHPDNPSIVASEQAKSVLFFNLSDLSAERRLGEVQSEGGLREVELFAQDNDRVQVTYFDVEKHFSTPAQEFG